jgi:hypothetical protein
MTDKELLELAAKAAGWTGWQSKHGYWNVESPDGEKTTHCHNWNAYCQDTGEKLKEPSFADAIAGTNWNPLTDDGDALRLAVKLNIVVWECSQYDRAMAEVRYGEALGEYWEFVGEDSYAATRRAITRAAAEIGKTLI